METTENNKPRLPKWAVLALIWIGPSLLLWLWWTQIRGVLLNYVSFPFFVLIPGLCVSRLILLFRSRRSVGGKIWRAVLWTLIVGIALFFAVWSPFEIHRSTRRDAEQKFEAGAAELRGGWSFDLPELGEPETLTYHYYLTRAAVWDSTAHALLCRYSPEDYPAEKAALEERVQFRTESLASDDPTFHPDAERLEPYVRIGNDEFRFLYPRNDQTDGFYGAFYKNCVLVVTNDETREIGYLVFYDYDLDLAEDLTEFINEYCGWSAIR